MKNKRYRSEDRSVLCVGCGEPVGVKGSPAAEKFPPIRGAYTHKSLNCRNAALAHYFSDRSLVSNVERQQPSQ